MRRRTGRGSTVVVLHAAGAERLTRLTEKPAAPARARPPRCSASPRRTSSLQLQRAEDEEILTSNAEINQATRDRDPESSRAASVGVIRSLRIEDLLLQIEVDKAELTRATDTPNTPDTRRGRLTHPPPLSDIQRAAKRHVEHRVGVRAGIPGGDGPNIARSRGSAVTKAHPRPESDDASSPVQAGSRCRS